MLSVVIATQAKTQTPAAFMISGLIKKTHTTLNKVSIWLNLKVFQSFYKVTSEYLSYDETVHSNSVKSLLQKNMKLPCHQRQHQTCTLVERWESI